VCEATIRPSKVIAKALRDSMALVLQMIRLISTS
jgi:hypothetical protein